MLRRLRARLRGEIPAREIEALRGAGLEAYEASVRLRDGGWSAPRHRQIAELCAWNAFALQTLADRLIEADYTASPATAGYLPRVTALRVMDALVQVGGWLTRARQAEGNPNCVLDVHVPAPLPRLAPDAVSRTELVALRETATALQAHVAGRLDALVASAPAEREAAAARLRQAESAAGSALEYAERLWRRDMPDALVGMVAVQLLAALEQLFALGQLAAMPSLLDEVAVPEAPVLSRPGERGFDPWRLTDPQQAGRLRVSFHAARQLAELWEADPEPERTLAIQAEIERALERGEVQRLPPGASVLAELTRSCPWPPVYVAFEPVTIGGRHIEPLHPFTLVVGREDGAFRRAIVVAPRPRIPRTAAASVLARSAGDELPVVVPRAPGVVPTFWDTLDLFDVFDV